MVRAGGYRLTKITRVRAGKQLQSHWKQHWPLHATEAHTHPKSYSSIHPEKTKNSLTFNDPNHIKI